MLEHTLESKFVYRGRLLNLRLDTVELPSGRRTTREIVEHRPCVAIVPLDSEGNVLLVRQYRKAVEEELLEIPAGNVELGEQVEDCVRRELGEETGFTAGKLEKLGGFYSAPGYTSEYLHLYLATELAPGDMSPASDETIEVVPVPLSDTPKLIASGEIQDAKSIAGLLWVICWLSSPG